MKPLDDKWIKVGIYVEEKIILIVVTYFRFFNQYSTVYKINWKGKLPERVGRKTIGLSPELQDTVAKSPGKYSTFIGCVLHGF